MKSIDIKIHFHEKSIIVISMGTLVLLTFYFLSELGLISTDSMPWIIVSVVLILNIVMFYCGQKSYIITIISCVLLVLLAGTAYSINHSNTDIEAYEGLYSYIQMDGDMSASSVYLSDFGYRILMKACISLGLDFNLFTSVVSLFSLLLIYSTIRYLTNSYHLVLACYAIMTFTYDVYQLRFLLGYAIVVFGLKYYLIEKFYKPWKFIFFIILGSLIHFSMLFYMIFLIKPLKRIIIKYYYFIIAFSAGLIFLCYFYEINIFNVLNLNMLGRGYGSLYAGRVSIFTSFYIVFIVLYMVYLTRKVCLINNNEFTQTLFLINLMCTLTFPFLAVTLEFERFLRPILLIDCAYVFNEESLSRGKRVFYSAIFLLICFIRASVMVGLTDHVVNNNYFMDFLLGAK